MNIVILGANGFIGKYIMGYFSTRYPEHNIIACGRSKQNILGKNIIYHQIDVLKLSINDWKNILPKDAIVINCVGVLNTPKGLTDDDCNALWLHNIFKAGVKKFIYFSAMGVEEKNRYFSPYISSRLLAEKIIYEYASSLDIETHILKPSFIYAQSCYGGSESLRALAGSDGIIPLYNSGNNKFAPVCIHDINRILDKIIHTKFYRQFNILPISGPDILTTKEIVYLYVDWLGHKPVKIIKSPKLLMCIMGYIGKYIPLWNISPAMIKQMDMDYIEEYGGRSEIMGIRMTHMKDFLLQNPANTSERISSNISFLRPIMYIIVLFMWLFSGILGLLHIKKGSKEFPFIPKKLSYPMVIISSLIDIAFGLNMLRKKPNWIKQIIMVLSYTIGLTCLKRKLWSDLYGGLMKNIPIIGLLYILLKTENKR